MPGRDGRAEYDVEGLRTRITARLAAVRLSANEASRRAGLNAAYVNDLLSGRSGRPTIPNLSRLAPVLDCDVGHLLGIDPVPVTVPAPGSMPTVFSTFLPDADGFSRIGAPLAGTPHSHFASAPPGSYGIVVPDDAMAPRYAAGECVIAAAGHPVSGGRFAAIRHRDGRVAVRRIELVLPDLVRFSSLDGRPPREVATAGIASIDRLLGTTELSRARAA